jgi:hypothetical protein
MSCRTGNLATSADVRFGSKADIDDYSGDVCFTPSNVLVKRLAADSLVKGKESAGKRGLLLKNQNSCRYY